MADSRSRAFSFPTFPAIRRAGLLRGSLSVAGIVTAAVALGAIHQSVEFETVHGFARTVTLASLLSLGLMIATAGIGFILNLVAALGKVMAGIAVVGTLSFAQQVDPSDDKAKAGGDGEIAPRARNFDVGLYAGGSITQKSDLKLNQPGGTDLLMKKVLWRSESTQTEPYWGARFTYWSQNRPMLGTMLDYTHAKVILWHRQKPEQSGTRDGKPVPKTEWVTETFRRLDFTHGLNFIAINGMLRLPRMHPRITPYVGIGIGPTFPHVYLWREGKPRETRTYKHMITGPTFQVLAGVDWRIFVADNISWFTEYKLNYSRHNAPLKGGGTLKTNLWTHQIVPLGFTYRPPMPWRMK